MNTATNYILAALVVAGIGVWVAMDYRVRVGNRVLKVNVDLENSRWLTKRDIKQNDGFTTVSFDKLNTVADGIPVIAEVKNDDLTITLRKPIHTLVIGSTGTGKHLALLVRRLKFYLGPKHSRIWLLPIRRGIVS